MDKKKILIFSLAYFPRNVGGAEIAVKEITDRLGEYFDFDMITMDKIGPKIEKIGNVNIYRVGSSFFNKNKFFGKTYKYLFIFQAFFKGISLQYKNNYNAVWSIMANYAGFSAMFFKLFFREVPLILTLQEGDPISYIRKRVGIFYPWFAMIFKYADIIQVISNYLADWAREEKAKCPIVVVPNGVNVNNFQLTINNLQSAELKRELGFSENDVILITTSRLVEKNAVDDIINSLTYLPANVKLLIIGKGILEDKLKYQVKDLNFEERVIFLGYISHNDLPKYLSMADIFIRPSISEGFGNSFIEAMAMKIPVITTPVGGIIDFLIDGETGLFCEVKNPKSIALKVEKIIRDKESKDYIVENAYKMVLEKYDWDLIAEDMKEKVFNPVRD